MLDDPSKTLQHTPLGDINPRPWGYSINQEYIRNWNYSFLTAVLINSGYRLYNLAGADGLDRIVWARPVFEIVDWKRQKMHNGAVVETEPIFEERTPDLSGILVGEVTRLPMNGRLVGPYDTILHGEGEGGTVNMGGKLYPELAKPNTQR